MNSDDLWQILSGIFIIAIIFMLVRPGSPAAQAVSDISDALAALIKTATNYQAGNNG